MATDFAKQNKGNSSAAPANRVRSPQTKPFFKRAGLLAGAALLAAACSHHDPATQGAQNYKPGDVVYGASPSREGEWGAGAAVENGEDAKSDLGRAADLLRKSFLEGGVDWIKGCVKNNSGRRMILQDGETSEKNILGAVLKVKADYGAGFVSISLGERTELAEPDNVSVPDNVDLKGNAEVGGADPNEPTTINNAVRRGVEETQKRKATENYADGHRTSEPKTSGRNATIFLKARSSEDVEIQIFEIWSQEAEAKIVVARDRKDMQLIGLTKINAKEGPYGLFHGGGLETEEILQKLGGVTKFEVGFWSGGGFGFIFLLPEFVNSSTGIIAMPVLRDEEGGYVFTNGAYMVSYEAAQRGELFTPQK